MYNKFIFQYLLIKYFIFIILTFYNDQESYPSILERYAEKISKQSS